MVDSDSLTVDFGEKRYASRSSDLEGGVVPAEGGHAVIVCRPTVRPRHHRARVVLVIGPAALSCQAAVAAGVEAADGVLRVDAGEERPAARDGAAALLGAATVEAACGRLELPGPQTAKTRC
jgi:hypothetical protein